MKICMVSIDFLPAIGGIAGHIANLSRALTALGHEVVVVRPRRATRSGLSIVEYDGITTIDVDFLPSKNRVRETYVRTVATLAGIRLAESHMGGIDVLHQHDFMASTLACRLTHHPFVFTNHSSHFLEMAKSRLGRLQARYRQRGMSRTIAPSPELATRSQEIWGRSAAVTYIPNGVDVEEFRPRPKNPGSEYVRVLCPRRMDPKNGVIYLVQAFLQLRERFPDLKIELLLTGGALGTEHEAYDVAVRRVVAESRFGSEVIFLGNVPSVDMPKIFQASDIVVIPSLVEAVSLSALEAMATGLPVIASNVGGLPEIVLDGRTGVLVPPRDVMRLEAAIRQLATSKDERSALGSKARELVADRYTWERIAQETLSVYAG